MKRLRYSTDCEHCFKETGGPALCTVCDQLRCDYCGGVYRRVELEACEWCVLGAVPNEDFFEVFVA